MTVENNTTTETYGSSATPNREPLIKWGWLRAVLFIVTLVALALAANGVIYLVQNSGESETAVESVASDESGQIEDARQTEEFVEPEGLEQAGEVVEPDTAVTTDGAEPIDQAGETEETEPKESPSGFDMLLQMAITTFLIVLLIALFRRYVDRQSMASLGLAFDRQKGIDLIYGMLWGIGLISAVFGISLAMGTVEIENINPPAASLVTMFFFFVLVGFNEEIMFRGYLLNNLMASWNKYLSLLIIALLFGIGHSGNPNASAVGILNIVLAGLLLGIYYVHVKNLWFPIGMHLTWNFFQGPIYGAQVSGVETESMFELNIVGSELMTGGEFGFEASLPATFVIIAAIIIIHLKYREKPEPVSVNPAIVSE